jgi:hypothetical protein
VDEYRCTIKDEFIARKRAVRRYESGVAEEEHTFPYRVEKCKVVDK